MINTNDRALGLVIAAGRFNSSYSITINVEDDIKLILSSTLISEPASVGGGRVDITNISVVNTSAYIMTGRFSICDGHTIKSSKDDFVYDVGFRMAITRALLSVKDLSGRFNSKEFKTKVWSAYNEATKQFDITDR